MYYSTDLVFLDYKIQVEQSRAVYFRSFEPRDFFSFLVSLSQLLAWQNAVLCIPEMLDFDKLEEKVEGKNLQTLILADFCAYANM